MTPVSATDIERARRIGEFAARRALPPASCPYAVTGGPRNRALAAAWMNAYLHRRPPAPGAVDYSG